MLALIDQASNVLLKSEKLQYIYPAFCEFYRVTDVALIAEAAL